MAGRNTDDDLSDYLTRENVARVERVMNETMWRQAFPWALPVYTYDSFLKAVAKYPKFCGEAQDSSTEESLTRACQYEMATFLAHVKHESGSLQYVNEDGCPQGKHCSYRDEKNVLYPPAKGQKYFGRGAL